MVVSNRYARFAEVLAHRTPWVRCAVEHVHHRHNTSAMLRTADALGLHHVHLVGDEHFRPSPGPSRGAARWLNLHHHRTTSQAIEALQAEGVAIWVADLNAPPVPPSRVPVDRPVCLWFGAEALGVSEEARAAADGVVTIPMHGFAQSLNVSVAAALILHVVTERARDAHGDAILLPPDTQRAWLSDWIAREQHGLVSEADIEAAMLGLAGLQSGETTL